MERFTADELIRNLRAALAEELEGIRALDATRVARANTRKATVIDRLQHAPAADRPALYEALASLASELQQNLVLLTHARAYLEEPSYFS